MAKEDILIEYDNSKHLYENLGKKCVLLINELIDKSIPVHQVYFRLKDKKKLEGKIELKDKYSCLGEITDICGIRIITYLESDVDNVAKIIEKEFNIDSDNSIDKRNLKEDQFGYKSLHYVASLDGKRLKLPENIEYKGLKFEIQIRSILQHARAEIEHDLGYKGKLEIPSEYRRDFTRIAALLESADIAFDKLKEKLSIYGKNIKSEIKKSPSNVHLNKISILSFVGSNTILKDVNKIIVQILNASIVNLDETDMLIKKCFYLGINDIGKLENLLKLNKDLYINFLNIYLNKIVDKGSKGGFISKTFCLGLFVNFLALNNDDINFKEYFLSTGKVRPLSQTEKIIKNYTDSISEIKNKKNDNLSTSQ